jgi:DNA-binding transcriptional MocR family regulator
MVGSFLQSGAWDQHLANLREIYRTRRDHAIAALTASMPSNVHWTYPAGGFFLWLTLPDGLNAQQIKREALQQGVLISPGNGFFVNPADGDRHIRIAFSCVPLDELNRAIQILGRVIQQESQIL